MDASNGGVAAGVSGVAAVIEAAAGIEVELVQQLCYSVEPVNRHFHCLPMANLDLMAVFESLRKFSNENNYDKIDTKWFQSCFFNQHSV